MVDDGRPADGVGEPPGACELCSRTPEDGSAVLTWTLDVHDDGHWEWLCDTCSREHLPEIEARLHLGEP